MPTATKSIPIVYTNEIIMTNVQLSWLKVLFHRKSNKQNWTPATDEKAMQRARWYILYILGVYLFSNTNENNVLLKHLHFLEDLHRTTQ